MTLTSYVIALKWFEIKMSNIREAISSHLVLVKDIICKALYHDSRILLGEIGKYDSAGNIPEENFEQNTFNCLPFMSTFSTFMQLCNLSILIGQSM